MREAFRDGGGDVFREGDAIGHGRPLDRHERHDVDGADAGVFALV